MRHQAEDAFYLALVLMLEGQRLLQSQQPTVLRLDLARMKEAGMRVVSVASGGYPSHAPAHRAYEKAGFTVQIPSVWLCRML